ncbi:ComF family protein [Litoribrevibacter euphylliae]|uniref:ComF family protein n=1 Tax=Litoribrevibacter euphylliae TaxID=1834034 RepID=A0ABV7HLD9_9GAMM
MIANNHCRLCYFPLTTANAYFCTECTFTLPFITNYCSSCALPTNTPLTTCGHCQKTPYFFDNAFSLFEYTGQIQTLIHQFKANQLINLNQLQMWLFSAYYHKFNERKIDALIPIPSSIKSIIKRGHVPAQTLASLLSHRTSLPIHTNLFSKRWFTPSQKNRNKQSRKHSQQFKPHQQRIERLPKTSRILLIDDVMTTGESANEIARHLKAAGIQQVDVLTIARTPLKH